MSSKKHSNAAAQSSRGSASKGQMQLTSYLWKKSECYGKTMEKLWDFFSGDLYEPCIIVIGMHQNMNGTLNFQLGLR